MGPLMSKKKETSDERRAALTGSIFAAAQSAEPKASKRGESPSIVGAALGTHSEGLSSELKRLRSERDSALASGQMLVEIEPDRIRDALPRDRLATAFSDADFEALKLSIQKDGQLIPVAVRSTADGTFEIAAGRRRLEACRQLGIPVLARVQELDDGEMLQLQYEENEQRSDITSFERARWYQAVQGQFSLSTPELARRFKISQPMIVKYLKLARLPDEIIDELDDARDLSLGDSEKLHKTLGDQSPKALAKHAVKAKGQGTKAQIRAMLSIQEPRSRTPRAVTEDVQKDERKIATISSKQNAFSIAIADDLDSDTRTILMSEISKLLRKHL